MKKGFAFLLAGVLACSCFTGCGGAKDSVSESSETSQIVTTAPAETKSIETTVTKSAGTSSQDSLITTKTTGGISLSQFVTNFDNRANAVMSSDPTTDAELYKMTKLRDEDAGGATYTFYSGYITCSIYTSETDAVSTVIVKYPVNILNSENGFDSSTVAQLLALLVSPIVAVDEELTRNGIAAILGALIESSNASFQYKNVYLTLASTDSYGTGIKMVIS